VRFDRRQGRPAVVVKETVGTHRSATAGEVRHVYVQGVGEVERQELLRINSQETRIVREMRLVEDSRPGTGK
jgi:hypothetical protein